MTEPSLLLLIPAYNEERRIEPVLRDYARYFREQYRGKFQLVVVLNGCRDNTLGVVQRVAAEYREIGVLEFADPIGKGGALIEGLKLFPISSNGLARPIVSSARAGCRSRCCTWSKRATASLRAACSI
jgi:cellulose synthase/poly-beta-1,6-N-acetylglucosamine synthase-like glycosyltransferase